MGTYLETARKTLDRVTATDGTVGPILVEPKPCIGLDHADLDTNRPGAVGTIPAPATSERHNYGPEPDGAPLSPVGVLNPRTVERWPLHAEVGLPRCRACRGPILFGEVELIRDTNHPDGRKPRNKAERWIKLDPDGTPHGCRTRGAGRIVRSSEFGT